MPVTKTARNGRTSSWRSRLSVLVAITLGMTIAIQSPEAATAEPKAPAALEPQVYESVGEAPIRRPPEAGPAPSTVAAGRTRPAPVWPAPGSAEVAVAPVRGTGYQAGVARNSAPVSVRVGNLPVSVGPAATVAGAEAPTRVRVEVVPRSTAEAAGVDGILVKFQRADGVARDGSVNVRIDYGALRTAYGGDWVSRLRLIHLPDCGPAGDCSVTEIPSRTDSATESVVGDVPVTRAGTMVALAAGPSGGAGSFTASSLATTSTWSHGGSSGGFNWSYPMRTPPAVGGPQAAVNLAYSSQSVDGRHAASNNQPSWIGEGFEYTPGFIERRYRPCADDMDGGNNTEETGDLCWAADNATLNLGGGSVELLKDASGRWHATNEDGSKIERLTGMTANGDDNGEYWRVTAPNGTRYWYGKHRLDGWTDQKAVTNSVLTVPVYGNHSGEPCHASTFAASDCGGKRQAWRWNLDYVQDIHGNTMSLWYARETNYYAKNMKHAAPVVYDRAGVLSRIDYGTDSRSGTDTVYTGTPVPARVEFTPADRCLSSCGTRDEVHWPDTPFDQECTASTNPCLNGAPTFWTTKRLSVVTTRVWKDGAYKPVDSWTLRHQFPDPGDATRAGLWLAGITHRGHNTRAFTAPELPVPEVTLPEVRFEGAQMNNRVDSRFGDWAPAMNWWRVTRIINETGGEIFVTYSGKECVVDGTMPAAPDNNKVRCYPVKWTPPTYTSPITDYFHKYVVTEVQQIDHTGTGKTIRTRYEYPPKNIPLWHYDSEDGVTAANRLTWGQWRGYPVVITRVGEGAEELKAETLYFRGMHGDKTSTGTRTISVTGVEGGPVTDHDSFAGLPREQITYLGSSILGATISDPWRSDPPTATRPGTPPKEARFVRVAGSRTREAVDGGAWRRTSTATTFDSYGMPTSVEDRGLDSVPGDENCIASEYVRNTSGENWLLNPVKRIHGWADNCATPATSAAQITSDTRFIMDDLAYGAPPTAGKVTEVEEISSFTAGTRTYYSTGTAAYDAHGRLVETTDIAGEKTATQYTPAAGGPLTATTTVNPLLWSTTTDVDPATGLPTKITDQNSRPTTITYDAIGRTTGVWLPGRAKATFPNDPTTGYAYNVSNAQPSAITTRSLNAEGDYTYTYDLIDSLGRPTQTQTKAYGGGRILTDSLYDSVGRVYRAYGPYYNSGTAGTTHFLAERLDVPRQTETLFDSAGRATDTIQLGKEGGLLVELWRTTVSYHGDHTTTAPPEGGTATTLWTDARGRSEKLWQHHGQTPTGGYDETRYTYHPSGELATVRDASNNTWSYTYDIRGLTTSVSDPDKGTTTMTYNNLLQLEKVSDSRPTVADLAFTYDRLGRLTTVRENSTAGTKRAEWTYDTPAKGLTKSSSRWIGANEYKSELVTVDPVYRPTQTKITIPASEGNLAGTYINKATYQPDGSPATMTMPAVPLAGLAEEKLTVEYNDDEYTPEELKTNHPGITHYINDASYTNLYELNTFNRSTALVGAGYVQTGQTYDPSTGRVAVRETIRSVAPQYISRATYKHDDAGNVTRIDDDPGQGPAARDTQCFRYDHLRRLTDAWTPASNDCEVGPAAATLGGPAKYWTNWSFGVPTDPKGRTGNRLSQTEHATSVGDITTTYTYPNAGSSQPHRLESATIQDNAGTRSVAYAYDPAGNLTSRPGPSGQQTLTWDPEGHLATLADNTGTSSYVYGAEGNRLISKDATGATLHLGDTEIRAASSGGTVTATRYYTFAGEVVAQRTSSGGLIWLAGDHQGTGQVAVTADTSQTVTQRRTTPFGTPRGASTWPSKRGFVGGYQDPTGLTHLGAREYDPQTGRFISVDPLIDFADPQALNPYTYSVNNPVTHSDPTGLTYCIEPGDCPSGYPSTGLANALLMGCDADGNNCWEPEPHAPPSVGAVIIEFVVTVAVGFTPAGVVIDASDAAECLAELSVGCTAMTAAGVVPGGDFPKRVKRLEEGLDKASDAKRAADEAAEAARKAIDDVTAHAPTGAERRAEIADDIKVKLGNSAANRAAGNKTPDPVKPGGGPHKGGGGGSGGDGNSGGNGSGGQKLYGPFSRVESPTQTPEVARQVVESGELWGRPSRRWPDMPEVQAYDGPLSDGIAGIEFYTPVAPAPKNRTPPGQARWLAGMPGVREEDGYAKIPVIVTRQTQY